MYRISGGNVGRGWDQVLVKEKNQVFKRCTTNFASNMLAKVSLCIQLRLRLHWQEKAIFSVVQVVGQPYEQYIHL